MARFERIKDKWKHLREGLYGNVEPKVTLEAVTVPLRRGSQNDIESARFDPRKYHYLTKPYINTLDWDSIEQLPALAAGVSYGSKEKMESDSEKAIALNRNLIKRGHFTPLEAIQLNFHISGISKACGAQISRHRIGQGHVSASRRFKTAEPKFIYPVLDYIDNETYVEGAYSLISASNRDAYETYVDIREGKRGYCGQPPLHKEDARVVLPISYATERTWWINVRALRDFFRLRLAADSEWEIRRLAWMMYDMVAPLLPSLFEDLMAGQKMPYSMFPKEPYDPDNEENTGWAPTPEFKKKFDESISGKLRYGDPVVPLDWLRVLYNESKTVTNSNRDDFHARMRSLLSKH
jgi:thymidylate synthase (FAD)